MSKEYEDLESPEDIGQGDVIQWTDKAVEKPWKQYGVVITADCDLHRNKHGGLITYLPALTTTDFLWEHWRPIVFGSEQRLRIEKLGRKIDAWSIKGGTPSSLSVTAVESWLRRTGREELLDELGCRDRDERNRIGPLIDNARLFVDLLDSNDPDLAKLERAFASLKGLAHDDVKAALAQAVQKRLGSLPGDIFHLPVQPFDDKDGLFVMMRHVRQCAAADIAIRPDDLRYGGATARRIARLSPTFRYAMTQAFARVFSDIGLPEDHEERRKSAAARFFEGLAQ